MIKIRIKVKSEGTTHTKLEFVEDNYIASRQNPNFLELVEQTCKDSGLEHIVTCSATVYFEDL